MNPIFNMVPRADFITGEVARERPILFSGPMVCAILNGKKTQTRRLVKEPQLGQQAYWTKWEGESWRANGIIGDIPMPWRGKILYCPYGVPGDRLWVKETFQTGDYAQNEPCGTVYRATDPDWESTPGWKWKPSIFMPRWASRITLEIAAVRVERLQNISEGDAIAEGVNIITSIDHGSTNPVAAYRQLWESIHGQNSWARNEWVWVLEFKRVKP